MSKTELYRLIVKDILISMNQNDECMQALLLELMNNRPRWNKAIDAGVDVLYTFADQIVELES